jgi:hypothetical protein
MEAVYLLEMSVNFHSRTHTTTSYRHVIYRLRVFEGNIWIKEGGNIRRLQLSYYYNDEVKKDFSLLHSIQTVSKAHPASHPMATRSAIQE